MSQDKLDAAYFSPDVQEFIGLLTRHDVRYVVVGGEAVIYYGHARLTGDIDFFYDRSPENSAKLFAALRAFWDDKVPGIERAEELEEEAVIVQFGRPPNRIDLLSQIDGVSFAEAWDARVSVTLTSSTVECPLYFLGLSQLIRNKEASARPKDQEDLEFLRRVKPR